MAAEHPDGSIPQPYNFDSVRLVTRNMNPSELVVQYGSYTGEFSAMGLADLKELSAQLGIGTDRPDLLEIQRYGTKGDVAARPVRDRTPSCLKIKWSKDNKKARVDLGKLLMLQRLPMQKRTRAHIDISVVDDAPGAGRALVFHLSSAAVRPVEKRKQDDSNTTAAPKTDIAKPNNEKK